MWAIAKAVFDDVAAYRQLCGLSEVGSRAAPRLLQPAS